MISKNGFYYRFWSTGRDIFCFITQYCSYTNCGLLISTMVFLCLLWFHISPSFIQGLFCKKTTSWHYDYSILSDFPCIPSFMLTMDLLQLHHNHYISHPHASFVQKYSSVEVSMSFCLHFLQSIVVTSHNLTSFFWWTFILSLKSSEFVTSSHVYHYPLDL